MRYLLTALTLTACAYLFCGCAGNPLETNNVTKDGRMYRETEQTEHDSPRTTLKFKAAEF